MMQTGLAIALAVLGFQQNYLALSFDHYRAGRYQESIEAAQTFLKANPNSAAAYNNIAVSYLGLHKFDEAIQGAQQALRLEPDFALAKNNLAWIQQEKAKAHGLVALPVSATATPESYLTKSLEAYQRGQFQECISAANEALRLRPGYADAYNNIGACSASLSKWDDAIRNDQEALRLRPDFQLAKNNLAYATQQRLVQHKNR